MVSFAASMTCHIVPPNASQPSRGTRDDMGFLRYGTLPLRSNAKAESTVAIVPKSVEVVEMLLSQCMETHPAFALLSPPTATAGPKVVLIASTSHDVTC